MRVLSALVAALFMLAGCQGDPEPKEPKQSPTASPVPSSTATPPVLPDLGTENSPSGAATFVQYWVNVSNYASQTGDVKELERISDPKCEGCQAYIDLYRKTYADGGYFRGGELGLANVKYAAVGEGFEVYFELTSESGIGQAGSRHEPAEFEGWAERMIAVVGMTSGEWRLHELSKDESK